MSTVHDFSRPPSHDEMLAAAKRELGLRERVYPFRVETRKMTQAQANKELWLMRGIVAEMERLAAGARLL